MDPVTIGSIIAGLAVAFKVLDMADRAIHTFGINKIIATQFRHLAAMPGNKLAPLEEKIAEVVDSGADLEALKKAESVTDAVTAKGVTTLTAVASTAAREIAPDVFKG